MKYVWTLSSSGFDWETRTTLASAFWTNKHIKKLSFPVTSIKNNHCQLTTRSWYSDQGKKKNQIKWSKVYFYLKTFKKSITSAQLSIYLFFLFLLINIKNKKIRKNPIFQTWSFSKTYRSFYCRYVILFKIICGWRQ